MIATSRPIQKSTVSVLITTYAGENADHLKDALNSITTQTEKADEIILVVDGPVDHRQLSVINTLSHDAHNQNFRIIHLPENGGLAHALNHGLAVAHGDYIMRMDSDDIALPDRLEIEKLYLDSHPDIDLVASWSSEFTEINQDSSLKISPTNHDALVSALHWRNVIAHPSIMVRRKNLIDIKGYDETIGLLEDYDLYIRLINKGVKFHCIPKVLLRVRTSIEQRARRGNFTYLANEIRFRYRLFRSGFLSFSQFLVTTGLYTIFRLTGAPLRDRLYASVRS